MMEEDVRQGFQHLASLLENMKDSLERELHGVRQEMQDGFAQVASRFDTQAVRMDRHAALWQTGRRWSGKMDVWAERVDSLLEVKDRQIAELRQRIENLESHQNGTTPPNTN
jgi:BMFP domain-containing protein YqiC